MIEQFLTELQSLSSEGGWVFWCLVALGFGIAFSLLSIWFFLQFPNSPILHGNEWRRVVMGQRNEQVLARLRSNLGGGEISSRMQELDQRLFATIGRRIPFAFVLIGAAPLVGLLGTVSGMFTTFDGLAGVSGSKPVDVISRGVSEALITTQTGLIISVPTFIIACILNARFQRMRHGFQKLEATLLQSKTQAAD